MKLNSAALSFIAIVLIALFSSAILKSDTQLLALAELEKQNVVYIGTDNPVQVSIPGIVPESLDVIVVGASVHPTSSPGHFIIRVTQGSKITLDVGYRKNGNRTSCGKFEYRIKKIPDPVTYINNIRNEGVILKENLQAITGVFTRMENFDFDVAFKPQSFSMSVIVDGEWKEYKADGPALTEEMKMALTKVEEEDKIIFHGVMTKGPGDEVRKVNNVVITVK